MAARLTLNAALCVDLVVLTIRDDRLALLAVRRGVAPHRGRWALPGGFVLPGEDLLDAAGRELLEETGLRPDRAHLEQLATYATPGRDPRGPVVTVAHLALLPALDAPTAGSDAADARWLAADDVLDRSVALAFDHARIVGDGVERARAKLEYGPLATAFCAEEFTIAELRRVYEIVWGATLDARNFHRKVTGSDGFVIATERTTTRDGGRPARLFRRGPAATLHPAMLRPPRTG